jgi:hypothetical protein
MTSRGFATVLLIPSCGPTHHDEVVGQILRLGHFEPPLRAGGRRARLEASSSHDGKILPGVQVVSRG